MINLHDSLTEELKTILPTYYELVLKSGIDTPCISYMELSNSVAAYGDTVGYSTISYQIKVWGNDIGVLNKYAVDIDNKLRPLGWARTACRELYDVNSTMKQKILTYQSTVRETF